MTLISILSCESKVYPQATQWNTLCISVSNCDAKDRVWYYKAYHSHCEPQILIKIGKNNFSG